MRSLSDLSSIPTSPPLIPFWIKYGVLGFILAFLLPACFETTPGPDHKQTQAEVIAYTTSSTNKGTLFTPVLSFKDAGGTNREVTLRTSSSEQPLAIGSSVAITYSPSEKNDITLLEDPYARSMRIFFYILAAPLFLLSAIFLGLRLTKVGQTKEYLASLVAQAIIPWLLPFGIFITLIVLDISFPNNLHIADNPAYHLSKRAIAGYCAAGILIIWYLLQWPLMVIRILRTLWNKYKHMKAIISS
ncbi:hypothetical protein KBD61_03730 [Patescibacteria group bacterium]|nr:hypothetical protein [Patescibacteria group bacterium]MBP9710107.1 hypothetical protein [Patescibacteria group bacterium]